MTLVYKYFANDARSAASSRGFPGIRLVPEPIVSECTIAEEIEAGIDSVVDDIIGMLTQPLTEEEKMPKPKETAIPSRIIFKGSLSEVNRFFYQRGWTDGLPVIPPTEDAVTEMLSGTDLPPDNLVAELEPRRGKATVEKIAINAVMAGALPTYMPVLIAGVKAMVSKSGMSGSAVSTGSWAPFWIINGPVRDDLHINSGFGVLSPGVIANATIGRAFSLIIKNIMGVRREIEDMGVLGNPAKYTMVVAENEEENPWEPLHVEQGLQKEDSAITVWSPNCYQQLSSYATDDMGILNTIVYNLIPQRFGQLGIMFTPVNANILANRGWNKSDIKKYIIDNSSVPWSHHPRYYTEVDSKRKSDELVPIITSSQNQPTPIQVFVAGGQGSWTGLHSGGFAVVTQKIELPANWDKLVAKYNYIVPTYVKY